jgi:hypothetical protein
MFRIRGLVVACAAMCVWAVPSVARATSIQPQMVDLTNGTFAGAFTSNTDVAVILFSLTDPSRIDVSTNSAAAGGFDPLLSLFRFPQPPAAADLALATWIADNDDRDFEAGDVDARLFSSPDVDLSRFDILDPGLYAIALTASFNYSTQFLFGQGFAFDGDEPVACATGDPVCAFGGTLTITPIVEEPTPTPEPGTLALVATALGGAVLRRHRRRESDV